VTENNRENCRRKQEISIFDKSEDVAVAGACVITTIAAAVGKRRRKCRSCWVHD